MVRIESRIIEKLDMEILKYAISKNISKAKAIKELIELGIDTKQKEDFKKETQSLKFYAKSMEIKNEE